MLRLTFLHNQEQKRDKDIGFVYPDHSDPISIAFVFSAHAFIKDAIKRVEDHQENNTELDQDRLFFLLNGVKNTLEISFQNLNQFLPDEMKTKSNSQ